MSEIITTANSEIEDKKFLLKEQFIQLKAAYMSYHGHLVLILP